MKSAECKTVAPTASTAARMGAGSWMILVVLVSLLAATLVVAYLGWTSARDTDVPTSGNVAMAIGVIFSLAVGFGLMALVFFSSRKGYDEPPVLIVPAEAIELPDIPQICRKSERSSGIVSDLNDYDSPAPRVSI